MFLILEIISKLNNGEEIEESYILNKKKDIYKDLNHAEMLIMNHFEMACINCVEIYSDERAQERKLEKKKGND